MTMAGPADPKKTTELTTISSRMAAAYGSGKYCPPGAEGQEACLDVEAVTKVLAESRDPKKLREVWEGWHSIGPGMKQDYARFVELSNEGAKEVGFADTGAMWRSRYDMAPDAFAKELDRLWGQLQPLYLSLHAHVRAKLHEKYGNDVPPDGPIPAHLLGNIWAQDWSNVYDLVAPAGNEEGRARSTPSSSSARCSRSRWRGLRSGSSPRWDSIRCRRLLGAVAVCEAARPRGGVPRQRVGHQQRGRSAHQDVHRPDGRGLHHHPSRARAQLLPARLQHSSR